MKAPQSLHDEPDRQLTTAQRTWASYCCSAPSSSPKSSSGVQLVLLTTSAGLSARRRGVPSLPSSVDSVHPGPSLRGRLCSGHRSCNHTAPSCTLPAALQRACSQDAACRWDGAQGGRVLPCGLNAPQARPECQMGCTCPSAGTPSPGGASAARSRPAACPAARACQLCPGAGTAQAPCPAAAWSATSRMANHGLLACTPYYPRRCACTAL